MSKLTKNEYTISDFLADYPNDDAVLQKIFEMNYGDMECCPKCGFSKKYVRVKGRRAYQCRKCYNQIYPTAGSIFDKTRVPLRDWFYAIFIFTTSKNGLSALELARATGVSPKTALRMLKRIRVYLVNDSSPFYGESAVTLDETFCGGLNKNRHYNKKVKNNQGRSYKDKVPVLGMIGCDTGRAIAVVIPNVNGRTLREQVLKYVDTGTVLYTDEYKGYLPLDRYYKREWCNHAKKQYTGGTNGKASTNHVESMWSVLKKTYRTYVKISRRYLALYVKEVIFRFNNRNSPNIFNDLLNSFAF